MKQAVRQSLHAAARRHAAPAARPAALHPLAAARPFSSSPLRFQDPSASDKGPSSKDDAKDAKKDKSNKANDEPDTTVEGRSPFAAFVEVLRDEVRKNREWQDSVKQLGGEVSKVQDSEAMQRAKIMYERARVRPLSHLGRRPAQSPRGGAGYHVADPAPCTNSSLRASRRTPSSLPRQRSSARLASA